MKPPQTGETARAAGGCLSHESPFPHRGRQAPPIPHSPSPDMLKLILQRRSSLTLTGAKIVIVVLVALCAAVAGFLL